MRCLSHHLTVIWLSVAHLRALISCIQMKHTHTPERDLSAPIPQHIQGLPRVKLLFTILSHHSQQVGYTFFCMGVYDVTSCRNQPVTCLLFCSAASMAHCFLPPGDLVSFFFPHFVPIIRFKTASQCMYIHNIIFNSYKENHAASNLDHHTSKSQPRCSMQPSFIGFECLTILNCGVHLEFTSYFGVFPGSYS